MADRDGQQRVHATESWWRARQGQRVPLHRRDEARVHERRGEGVASAGTRAQEASLARQEPNDNNRGGGGGRAHESGTRV